ncbi:hypothetical protein QQF64_028975 [Cirrhinus molitorella]|uniref:Uncharacterized protein n=1 Tax=Cirrhinus molitorella TaxID=172907 RepID=A0ABR3N8H9_9TELE
MAEWGLLAGTTFESGCCRGNEAVQCALSLPKPAQSDRRPWQAILAPPEPAVRTCFLSLFFCRQVGSHLLQELALVSEPGTLAKSQAPAWLPYPSSGCAYCSLFPLNEPPCRRPVLDTIRGVSP